MKLILIPSVGTGLLGRNKGDKMGSVKRIVSDIPPPKMQGDELVRMIQFEQNNPRKRLLGDPAKIDVIHAVAGVYRRGKYISLLPLPKFDRLPKSHRSFAARDDGHSPALRGGDFAVIDTRKREPVHGQLVLYVHGEHRAIVRLHLPPQSAYRAVQKEQEIDHPRPWWVLLYGRQPRLG